MIAGLPAKLPALKSLIKKTDMSTHDPSKFEVLISKVRGLSVMTSPGAFDFVSVLRIKGKLQVTMNFGII